MKKLLFLFFALASVTFLYAYDFQLGNFYYEITSDSTVMVTSKSASSPYNDGVTITSAIIPSSVSYSGKIFAVTAIDDYAFRNCTSLASVTIPTSIIEIGFHAFDKTALYDNSSKWENDVLYIGDCLIEAKPTLSGSYVIKSNTRLVAASSFDECSSLTAITIPENVEAIGSLAFYDCASLSKVFWNAKNCKIKSGTNIYGKAVTFGDAPIDSFVFGDKVERIPAYLCYGLAKLTIITIPENVTSIGTWVFEDCHMLTSVVWNAKKCADFSLGPFYEIRSQITSFNFGDSVQYIPASLCYKMDKVQSISLPATVTSIGKSAFQNCSAISSLVLGENLAAIGDYAFLGCSSLTSIALGNNVTTIGNSVFEDCSSLASVELGNGLTTIGDYTFENCSSLISIAIPENVKTIGKYAFQNCSAISSLVLGENLAMIGYHAFYNCSLLNLVTTNAAIPPSLDFGAFDGVTKSIPIYVPCGSEEAYKSATRWKEFSNIQEHEASYSISVNTQNAAMGSASVDKNTVCGATISAIPKQGYLFKQWSDGNTDNPRTLSLDKDTVLIAAFEVDYANIDSTYCIFYTSTGVVNPNNSNAFGANIISNTHKNGQGLITFDAPVTTIGEKAFYNCMFLKSIIIPSSVTSIGMMALGGTFLDSIFIPKNITKIEKTAFVGLPFLQSITVDAENAYYDSRRNCNAIIESSTNTLIAGCNKTTIPNDVKHIGAYAFYAIDASLPLPSLKNIIIPSSVITIGECAFANCAFEIITIPKNVTTIHSRAFYGCSSLDTIHVDALVPPTLGDEVFENVVHAHIPCGTVAAYESSEWDNQVGDFIEQECAEGTQLFYTSSDGNVVIPKAKAFDANIVSNVYESGVGIMTFDKQITRINSNAFNNTKLTTISIPSSVISLGTLFHNCPLTAINVAEDNLKYSSVEGVLFDKNKATLLRYPISKKENKYSIPSSVIHLADSAFFWCDNITSVEMPDNLLTIGRAAFQGAGITSINIPNGITYIAEAAFLGSVLTTITIPEGVAIIGESAFESCGALLSATIPNSVTTLRKGAFGDCYSMTKVTLGSGVTDIEDYAFQFCESLTSMTCSAATPPHIGMNVFEEVDKTIPIYVPCGSVDIYKSAYAWNEFSNIQEPLQKYSLVVNTQNSVMGSAKVDKNTACATIISAAANYGYQFKQWSDGNTDNPRTLVLDKDTSLIAEFEVEQKSCLIASGVCGLNGDNLTWQLSCDSILTIMGTGNMSEYSNDINQPWKEHASMIKSIVIKEGVTSIGARAFYNDSTAKYNSLKDITIPGTLTKTGANVFSGITSMESVYITDLEAWMDITHANSGGNPLSVAHHLYVNGVELTELVVPDGVKTIKKYVFCGCEGLKSLQLPSSLTLIDNSAFLGTGLTNLVLPEGLKIVDNSAFYNCNSLETIHISSTVQRLGNCSFESCKNLKGVYIKDLEAWCKMEMEYSSPLKTAHHLYLNNVELTEVDFPKSCTVVKDFAFEGCSYIKTIKLHAGITSIDDFAFDGCFALDSIVIPDSVTYIGLSALGDCSSMKKIEFLATTPPKILSGAQAFSGNDAEFVVPCGSKDDYIAAINIENKQAFWIDSLRFVEKLPSMYTYSITTSNEYQGSVAYLQRPTYCDDLTLSFLADPSEGYIFKQWSDGNTDNPRTLILDKDTTLTAEFIQLDSTRCIFYTSTDGNIVIPYNLNAFGATIVSNTYENGQGVILFDAPVTSIGMNAFAYEESLKSIIIPGSVDSIKSYAFWYCDSLESIEVLEGLIDIGYQAIYNCLSLRSINMPKSVTSIGKRNFRGCTLLTTIDVDSSNPNYSSDNGILFDKTKTTIIQYPAGKQDTIYTIPNYVKTIGEEAFIQCGALRSISIPNSVTNIGGGAFANCPSLVSMIIPNSVTDVGGGLFYNCSALKDIVLSENITALPAHYFQNGYDGHGFFEGCLSLDSIFIPSSVTSIGFLAFSGCSRITTITIPETVTYIGGSIFDNKSSLTSIIWNAKNCSNPSYLGASPFYSVRSQITSFVLGDKVENIPSYLCWGMDKINSLTIPNSTTHIGTEAFLGCSSLDTIDVKPYIPPILGKNVFDEGLVCNIHCGTLTAYESSEWVNQVDTFIEQPCEEGTKIFYTSSDGKIVIPYNLNAFGATIVSNIYQDGIGVITCDAPVQTIGENAFKYCSTLTSITLPNEVVNLGASAFNGCISLASFTIPEKITDLPPCVFQSCQSLKSIVIPNNVISIGFQAFTSCTSLDSLIIPNSVENLEPCAFLGCSSLRYVLLGDGLTSIGGSAFANCFSLTSITIPKGITSIGNSAFQDCGSIATITSLLATPPTASYSVFGGISKVIPIYVPCGTVAAYQSAEGWKEFTNIQEPLTEYSISITAQNDVMGSTSIDKNTACATIISAAANYGYQFKQWSDGNTDNPRTLNLNKDTALTAEFERNVYTISTAAINNDGITFGDTTALYLDSVTIFAIANPGCRFTHWADGNTDNPRKVQVTEDKLYAAYFITKSFVHNTIREYVCDNTEYINPITNQAVLISSTNPASLTWVDTILSDLTDSIYTFVITPIVPPTMLNDSVLSTLQGALPVLKQGEQPIVETSVAAITTYYKLTDTEAIADVTRVIWQKSDTIIPCDATIYTMILHLEDACGNVEEREFVFDVEERSIRVEETFASICNGESYIWSSNGKQYDNSGEYYDTLRLVNGCDELIRVLHLTVLPPMKTDTINLELSISELPYDWHGQTLMKKGTYTTREQYANVDCDSIEYILNLTIRPLDIPISITPPMAVCGNPIDVSITTEELENYIAETMFDAMDEMTIIWQIKINGEWEILTDAPLKGNTDEVVVRYVIYAAWGNVESPEMTISVQMPTPDNDVKRDGIATVSRYNNRIFLFHLNDFEAKYGWIPNPEQIVWYKVVDDVDEYGTAGDDVVVGVGHHYNLPDGAPIEGDYYGLVMQSDARVDANGCTGVYRTVVLKSSTLLNPRLVPNLAHPNEMLTLENLNPSEVSEIRVYSITGELITTYVAEQVSEFMFSAHHILGYYMVDVITGDDKVTLKYVVQ